MKQVLVAVYGKSNWIYVYEQVIEGNVTTRGEVYYDTRPEEWKKLHGRARAARAKSRKMNTWSQAWEDVDINKDLPKIILLTIFERSK